MHVSVSIETRLPRVEEITDANDEARTMARKAEDLLKKGMWHKLEKFPSCSLWVGLKDWFQPVSGEDIWKDCVVSLGHQMEKSGGKVLDDDLPDVEKLRWFGKCTIPYAVGWYILIWRKRKSKNVLELTRRVEQTVPQDLVSPHQALKVWWRSFRTG